MIHKGSNFIAVTCWIVLCHSFVLLPAAPLAHAEGRIWLVGEPSPGVPACDEFYDKWEAPGMPASTMAMFGLAREVAAANDCIDKGNVPMACKHWQGLLAVMDKMGPPLDESRGDVEKLMHEHNCEAVPALDSKSSPKSTPSSESAPVKSAPATGPSPAPDPNPEPGPTPAE